MTLEAWVRPTAIGTGWRTVMLKEQPGDLIYALYAGDGTGRAATHIFTTADRGVSGTTATPLNAWTHLAATYDGTTQRLYVNGVQAASRAVRARSACRPAHCASAATTSGPTSGSPA